MKLSHDSDTIVAIATPLGPGGIGIVRMSGDKSLEILRSIFRPSNPKCSFRSHVLYHGFVFDPETNEEIDEALCVYMKSPKTYTREDVTEIQCHSGPAILNQILDLCLRQGARLASPGEFTKRAYLAGRIDLAQAEAVDELVKAQATGLSRMSLKGLKGALSQQVSSIKEELIYCISALEVAIDYPEEEGEILEEEDIRTRLESRVIGPVSRLIKAHEISAIHRFGAKVLLVGRPNAGKSSLLNALSCEERAIVTEVPGTTRDIIEKQIEISSIPVILMDTAGIRHSPDPIEAMGIDKIRQVAETADLFLWLVDPVQGLGPEEKEVAALTGENHKAPVVVVINKMDLIEPSRREGLKCELFSRVKDLLPQDREVEVCPLSARTGEGLPELARTISRLLVKNKEAQDVDIAPNIRHKEVFGKVLDSLLRAKKALYEGLSPEIVAIDMRQALEHLGEITGETVTEDILDRIFSSFCLGK